MKRFHSLPSLFLLALLTFSLQSCMGIGGNSNSNAPNSKTITTNSSGQQVGVNENQIFKGKIYFTIDHDLWVYSGNGATRELLKDGDIYDPAVSPNGKWVAFIVRFKNYSELQYMSTNGGSRHRFLIGDGKFFSDPENPSIIKNTFYWYMQPAWSADGSHILFLSDLQKEQWYSLGGFFANAPFLDLQVFSLPFTNTNPNPDPATTQPIAYASYGDGGDRDPSYRPGHPNEIVYTHYSYDPTGTQQVIQIFLEDATMIANHPGQYTPLSDPGIAITPANTQNIQPAFSPDGNAIAYIRREASGGTGLYIMSVPEGITATPNDPATEKRALIPYTHSSHILSEQFISQPVWSPDGKQIAYLSYDNNTFDLWLANISFDPKTGVYSMKGSPVQLTTGGVDGNSRPFWTP